MSDRKAVVKNADMSGQLPAQATLCPCPCFKLFARAPSTLFCAVLDTPSCACVGGHATDACLLWRAEDMQQDAIDCAAQAMEKYNIEKDIAAYIKKEFDKKYNPTWHCIVGRNFGSYVTHETKHFIYFYLGQAHDQTNDQAPRSIIQENVFRGEASANLIKGILIYLVGTAPGECAMPTVRQSACVKPILNQ
eukprot:922-Rhodomonas_salina.3